MQRDHFRRCNIRMKNNRFNYDQLHRYWKMFSFMQLALSDFAPGSFRNRVHFGKMEQRVHPSETRWWILYFSREYDAYREQKINFTISFGWVSAIPRSSLNRFFPNQELILPIHRYSRVVIRTSVRSEEEAIEADSTKSAIGESTFSWNMWYLSSFLYFLSLDTKSVFINYVEEAVANPSLLHLFMKRQHEEFLRFLTNEYMFQQYCKLAATINRRYAQ